MVTTIECGWHPYW